MLTAITNVHKHKLPEPGAIGRIVGLSTIQSDRKCIAESYHVTDSPDYRFSIGIHTVVVRFLDNGQRKRVFGIWFEECKSEKERND